MFNTLLDHWTEWMDVVSKSFREGIMYVDVAAESWMRNLIKSMLRRLRMTNQSVSSLPAGFEFFKHSWNYYKPLQIQCNVNLRLWCLFQQTLKLNFTYTEREIWTGETVCPPDASRKFLVIFLHMTWKISASK